MKDYQTSLTAQEVRRRFRYVRTTGQLIRRVPVLGGNGGIQREVGSVAGSLHKDGYIYVAIDGRLFLAHRLAWLWVHGSWPNGEIDHRNGSGADNRWRNLRDASVAQNRQNTLGQRTRIGPYPGVYEPAARKGRFVAQIKHKGKVQYLGVFDDPESARQARVAAEQRLFGVFAGSMRPNQ